MPNKKRTTVYRTNLVNVGIGQGQMVMPAYLYSAAEFDEEGRTLSQSSFSSEGLLQERITREYDQKGEVIRESYYTEEDEPSEAVTFERDESGRLIREVKVYLDGSEDTTTYTYDGEGRLIEKVTVDDEGETDRKEIFEWKEKLLVRREVRDGEDEVTETEEFGYNDRGLVSEHRRVNSESGENFRMVIRYDKGGRKSSEALYDEDEELQTMTRYEYDEKGILVRSSAESARSKTTTSYFYDEQGNALGQEETDNEGNRTVFVEHSYDEGGQLSGSMVFINGKGISMSQHYELRYEYEWFDTK